MAENWCGWLRPGCIRGLLLVCFVSILMVGVAGAIGFTTNHPLMPVPGGLLETTPAAPALITCPSGYVCTIPGDAADKGYIQYNDTRPCGNLEGLPEYCYRAPLNMAGIAINKQVRPGSIITFATTPAAPLQVSSAV